METKEFNLSKKLLGCTNQMLQKKDAQEFIKILKEKIREGFYASSRGIEKGEVYNIINKLAGKDLIE